jgi:hypothetical protein
MYNNLNAKPLCKLLLLTFCAISTSFVFSQTSWSESFSDSNFTHAPIWEGDTASFLVSQIKELQLNAAAVSSSKLMFTNSQTIWEASWEFRVKYDFNPSTNNYSKVYFASQAGLQNGYYVELGGNSQDRIYLRKLENGNSTTLIQSSDDWLNTGKIDIQIKVERDQNGEFSLFADTSGFYVNIGTAADTTFYTSSVFAWECIYTSTRSDKFHLDDIVVSGKTFQDSIPPRVTHAKFLDSNSIELTFSEPIDTNSFSDLASFVLAPNGTNPNAVYASGFKSIRLDFTTPFSNRTQHSLWVEDIEDLFGNSVQDTAIDLFYFTPAWGDVILSEIMFDPSPIVQLPDQEYLELFNRSSYPINLDGWKLSNGNSSIGLFSFVLQPNDYLLITDASMLNAFNVQSSLGINWPSGFLPNSGSSLFLLSPDSTVVHFAEYNTSLFTNPNKSNGGWSLENKSVSTSCVNPLLWDGSEDNKGGTPGAVNSISINSTTSAPYMKHIIYKSPQHIEIVFSEILDSFKLTSSLPILKSIKRSLVSTSLDVYFSTEMQPNSIYEIELNFVSGCFGQSGISQALRFGIPAQASANDVWINEILFNPSEGNSDFVEIVNTSERCLVLNNLRFAQINEIDGLPDNVENITTDSVLLPPNEFWVFTENNPVLIEFHNLNPTAFVFESNLPSMPDNDGSIGVCTASLGWVDKLSYSNKWHHELISDEEDVSLERVSLGSTTQQSSNWHSATYSSGYATPTQANSQAGQFNSAGSVTLSTDLVTPNNDGLDDVLSINFNLDKPGWVGSIIVFDIFGREVLSLLNNKPVGVNEVVLWHGLGRNDARIKRGAYIIFVELWHPDGEKFVVKKGVGVYYEG